MRHATEKQGCVVPKPWGTGDRYGQAGTVAGTTLKHRDAKGLQAPTWLPWVASDRC